MRIEQPAGTRGSLKWIQRLVQGHPSCLDAPLRRLGVLPPTGELVWRAPLPEDGWAEYRDQGFLERIGHPELAGALRAFWPAGGPQWDGLAIDQRGHAYLIEAKAHASEMRSSCAAQAASMQRIREALQATKDALGADVDADWLQGHYQYANRLAHLHFLQSHGVAVTLVFLYFVGDREMHGPRSSDEWKPHLERARAHLGLQQDPRGVESVFPSVEDLQ